MSEAKAKKKKLSIPVKLAIALVLGVVAGLIFKEKASYVAFIGTLFIRLLKMCVYPLVLFSIIAGIANVADIVKLKKIGGQFLLYTFLSSAIAGVLGCRLSPSAAPARAWSCRRLWTKASSRSTWSRVLWSGSPITYLPLSPTAPWSRSSFSLSSSVS